MYLIEKDTKLIATQGFNTREMTWSELGFIYIGVKNLETLSKVRESLANTGSFDFGEGLIVTVAESVN